MSDSYQRAVSVEEARRRLGPGRRIVKLASNENPLGTSPRALAAVRAVESLHLYVDDAYGEMKACLAARHGLSAEHVIVGHGSNEIVKLVAEAFVGPDDEAIMALPSFALYRLVAIARGGTPVEIPLRDGVTDVDAMLAAVTERTTLVFLCEPNNPTGTALTRDAWRALVCGLPERVVLVVDQAYREYSSENVVDAIGEVEKRPRTVVLRTMSKIYGLAALRFGYGFADPETVAMLERIRLPFNVAAPALAGAMAALDDDAFVRASIANNEAGKAQLFRAFANLGLHQYPTEANFYALSVPVTATRASEDLLEEGIIVRSGDALRMPGRLRITVGTADENAFLLAALERLVPGWRA